MPNVKIKCPLIFAWLGSVTLYLLLSGLSLVDVKALNKVKLFCERV